MRTSSRTSVLVEGITTTTLSFSSGVFKDKVEADIDDATVPFIDNVMIDQK